MVERVRANPKEVQVALDEFQRGDLTVIVAVIIPVKHVPRLEREWAVLQREMRRELLAHYPFAPNARELADGGLPEVHSKELYQSQRMFRNDEERRPGYWKLHRAWLGRAVTILTRARPTVVIRGWPASLTARNLRELGLPSETFARDVPFKRMKAKMDRLQASPYVWTLNHTITYLEEYFALHKLKGTLLCDEHADGHGFSLLKTFEMVRERNPERSHLPAPAFASSRDHALLQAADVAAYVFGQVLYAKEKGKRPAPDILAWATRLMPYTAKEQFKGVSPKAPTARLLELLITNSGGPKAYQAKLLKILPSFLEAFFASDDLHISLNQDGLNFELPMYKAASEDAALSENKIAETGHGSQEAQRGIAEGAPDA